MYILDGRVRFSECDEEGRLSTLGMVNYLQDASTFHSEELGRGAAYMAARSLAWLIAAWQVEVLRLPRFTEPIRVETWCYDVGRSLARRNYVMRDEQGGCLVRADALWFVYDATKGRAVRIDGDQKVFASGEPRLDMPETRRRLVVAGTPVAATPQVVGQLQLDRNHHVNNAQYISMALTAVEELRQGEAYGMEGRRIAVQYLRQARLGDKVCPLVFEQKERTTVRLDDERGDAFAVVEFSEL